MAVISTPSTYTQAAGTKSSSGNNEVVATPGAGKRLVVKDLLVQNESSTDTTVLLKSGSTTKWRAVLAGKASISLSFDRGDEWRLGINEALNLDLSGANSHGYSIRYTTELGE